MDSEKGIQIGFSRRVPARVLACLSRTHITVILHPDVGLADGGVEIVIPIEVVPLDLRMPNSEFDMLFDAQAWAYTKVVRKGEAAAEGD
jgi:hypothetical protein